MGNLEGWIAHEFALHRFSSFLLRTNKSPIAKKSLAIFFILKKGIKIGVHALVSTYYHVSSRDTLLCVPGQHTIISTMRASPPYTWLIFNVGIVHFDLWCPNQYCIGGILLQKNSCVSFCYLSGPPSTPNHDGKIYRLLLYIEGITSI